MEKEQKDEGMVRDAYSEDEVDLHVRMNREQGAGEERGREVRGHQAVYFEHS